MAPKKTSTNRGTNILGKRIKEARARARPPLTQSDLVARLGVVGLELDRPTVTRIEAGSRFLRDYEIKAFAKALNVTVTWMFGMD